MKIKFIFTIIFIFVNFVSGRIEIDIYKQKIVARNKRHTELLSIPPTSDSVVLNKFLNGEYYGLVGVGSPSKTFKVIFDTTWADIWLPSAHCAWTEIVCKLHTQYDSSASSSYIANGTFVNLTNKELSLMGMLSIDTFHLPHVKVQNQTFLEATHLSFNPFIQYQADGVIGLAYSAKSNWAYADTFLQSMLHQEVIEEAIFTFYMNRDETTKKAGKIILGGKQRTHVKNDTITTLKVIEKQLWQIQMDRVFAVKNKTEYAICQKCNAIFDSSSNTIIGPFQDIQKLNYMLNAVYLPVMDRFTVNCRTYAKLPSIHFVLNGNEYVIQSKYYVQRMVLQNIEACFSPFVASSNPNPPFWQLGGAFMMQFYTEFDMDNNVINIGETVF